MSDCKSCGQPVVWAMTVPGGAAMPIDRDSKDAQDGSVIVFRVGPAAYCVTLGKVKPSPNLPVGSFTRYRSHYQTCSDPDQHRKAGKP